MTRRHVALATAVAVVWGANFVIIDEGLKVFPPLMFVALRFAVVLVPAILLVGPPKVPARYVIGVGAFSGAMQFALLFVSLSLGMPPGLASLVVQLQVVFTIAIASVVLGERPQRRQLAGALIALAGVGVIASTRTGAVVPLGALALCISGAASWGIGNVITRVARPPSAFPFLVWTSVVPPLPVFGLSLLLEGWPRIEHAARSLTVSAVLALLYVAYVSTGFGYAAWAFLLRRYPASTVAPFALIVPVVGLAAAAVFVHETPSVAESIGALVVLAGLALVTRSVRRTEVPSTTEAPAATVAALSAQGGLGTASVKGDEAMKAVNLAGKLGLFSEMWKPKTIAELNDYEVKVAKAKGEFTWHTHDDTDELFLVVKGRLTIRTREEDVVLEEGELFVVPRGVEHCPVADEEVHVLLIEPRGVVNTGDAGGALTAVPEPI